MPLQTKRKPRYTNAQLKAQLVTVIADNLEHEDYTHVKDKAKIYKQMSTGDGFEDLLLHFVPREDPDLFDQRKQLTFPITTSLCSSMVRPAHKIPMVNPAVKRIEAKTEGGKEKAEQVKNAVATIYGGQSLDDFMNDRFIDLSCDTDPNAWFLVLFKNDPGGKNEYQPYLREIPCETVIWFDKTNNTLSMVVLRMTCTYASRKLRQGSNPPEWEPCDKEGNNYIAYGENEAFLFRQTDETLYLEMKAGESKTIQRLVEGTTDRYEKVEIYKVDDARVFEVTESTYNIGICPAVQVGAIKDKRTKGRTYVNLWDPALPHLHRTVKTCSEMDLSMSLHAFPQKIVAQPRCMGPEGKGDCEYGRIMPGGKETCSECKGTGLAQVHTSTQDVITIALPKNKEDMVDLSKLVHYVVLPVDLLRFQDEFIDKLEGKCIRTVYNSDIFIQTGIVKTATEKDYDFQSIYDTLFPVGAAYSMCWVRIVTITAAYFSASDLIIEHAFPRDFKFKSVTALLNDLKHANESNAPSFVKDEMTRDLMLMLYQDQPHQMKKIRVKDRLDPFAGRSDAEIASVLASSECTRFSKVAFIEFKRILTELEIETQAEGKNFYELAENLQMDRFTAKVEELMDEIAAEQAVGSFREEAGEIDDPVKAAEDAIGKLPLSMQQLALSAQRAEEDGDIELANQTREVMRQMVERIRQQLASVE